MAACERVRPVGLTRSSVCIAAIAARPNLTAEMALLNIRTEQGAVRHSFPSSSTLLDVREWLLQNQKAGGVSVQVQRRMLPAPENARHPVLVSVASLSV